MANLAQMVNAIAPIVTTKEGAFVQPIYYPFLMHARSALDEAVDVHIIAPTVEAPIPATGERWHEHRIADLGPFSVLDAAATVNAARTKVAVTIVNRSTEEARGVEVLLRGSAFSGEARVSTLTADAHRPAPDIEGAKVEERSEPTKGDRIVVDLPASSFTVIETATAGAK
jgi:alpha-N-arabinofuranosidase